jgi:translation initiation factor 3 subunit F
MTQKLLDVIIIENVYVYWELIFDCFTVNACQKTKTSVKRQAGIASDLTQIVEASQQMENMLDTILAYVDDVMSGSKTADNTFGRSLLDMVHSVPKMTPDEFEEMLNSNRKVENITQYLLI